MFSKRGRAIEILSDINVLNGAVLNEDIPTSELGLSDLTFWTLTREDIQSYIDGDYSYDLNNWLLDGINLIVSELGIDQGGAVLRNLSTSNMIEKKYGSHNK